MAENKESCLELDKISGFLNVMSKGNSKLLLFYIFNLSDIIPDLIKPVS